MTPPVERNTNPVLSDIPTSQEPNANSSKTNLFEVELWDGNISTTAVVAEMDPEYRQQAQKFLNAVAPSGQFHIDKFYTFFDPNSDGWFSAEELSILITGSELYASYYPNYENPDLEGYDPTMRARYDRLSPMVCGLFQLMQQDHFFGDLGVSLPGAPEMTTSSKSDHVTMIMERFNNETFRQELMDRVADHQRRRGLPP